VGLEGWGRANPNVRYTSGGGSRGYYGGGSAPRGPRYGSSSSSSSNPIVPFAATPSYGSRTRLAGSSRGVAITAGPLPLIGPGLEEILVLQGLGETLQDDRILACLADASVTLYVTRVTSDINAFSPRW